MFQVSLVKEEREKVKIYNVRKEKYIEYIDIEKIKISVKDYFVIQ